MSDIESFDLQPDDFQPVKRKRQTKEQALYGVFYQENEEETGNYQKNVTFDEGKPLENEEKPGNRREKGFETQLEAKELEEMYGKGYEMLRKAGFTVGKGLGKHEQGTVAPVQIQTRRKNEGLNIEKSSPGGKSREIKRDKERWRKGYRRPKVEMEELDRLVEEYRQENREETDEDCRELTLETAVLRYRQEVVETERLLRHQQDLVISSAYDILQTQRSLASLESRLESLRQLSTYVTDRLDLSLDLSGLRILFKSIQEHFPALWQDLDIVRRVAVPMAVKGFAGEWQRWSVSSDYMMLKTEAEEWSHWLGSDASPIFLEWERSLQRFLQTRWKAKEETGSLIDALEAWKPILPTDTLTRIQGCLVDILHSEVERWEPTREKVPIHTWVHPWLTLLDLQELWPLLLQKLSRALQPWQPIDQSAYVVLSPWKPVLGKLWEPFCLRHILPKLAHAVSRIEINPQSQEIETMERVMDWATVLPERYFIDMLRSEFFPRWKSTLEHWLRNADDSGLTEIQTWYEGWQSLIPKHLLDLSEAFR